MPAANQTMSKTVRPHPKGVCFKTCVYREGPYMHAITTMVHNGDVKIFKASVDLRPIERALVKYHARLHAQKGVSVGWGLGSIAHAISHAVSSVGHAGIVKSIASNVKSVVQSKVTGGVIAATAVVFPPVGVPAAAAYAAANVALAAIDNGSQIAKKVQQIATTGSKAAQAVAHAKLPQIQQAMKNKALAQSFLKRVMAGVKAKDPGAIATSKIFSIVQAQRNALAHKIGTKALPPGSIPAMLIDERGRIVKGNYLHSPSAKAVSLYRGGKLVRDNFLHVGSPFAQHLHDTMNQMRRANPMSVPGWAR